MMEESVMLKSIHEDSSTVTSLCAVVDTCLSLGLKRRALGLFKTNSTTALMQKVSKDNADADDVMRRVAEIEQVGPGKRTHSTGDSTGGGGGSKSSRMAPLEKANSGGNLAMTMRYLWIRVALFEKKLQTIVCHLVHEAEKYYNRESIVSDVDYAPLLTSLLIGPCALEYTKVKSCYGLAWSDLPANELVLRHKISTGSIGGPGSPTGSCFHSAVSNVGSSLALAAATHISSSTNQLSCGSPVRLTARQALSRASSMRSLSQASSMMSLDGAGKAMTMTATAAAQEARSIPSQAREYVESLHQNQKGILLFGKNNVQVFPKDSAFPCSGYLSLHQILSQNGAGHTYGNGSCSLPMAPPGAVIINGGHPGPGGRGAEPEHHSVCLKWTPNRLMNGGTVEDKSASWQQAVAIDMKDIIFMHCHQDKDEDEEEGLGGGETLTLVATDGTQHPPLRFPPGQHLALFLQCLEASLAPALVIQPPVGNNPELFPDPASKQGEEISGDGKEDGEDKDNLTGRRRSILPILLRRKKEQTPEASTESNGSSTTSAMSSSATTKETDGSGAPTESVSDQTPSPSTPGQKTAFGVHTSSGRGPDQVFRIIRTRGILAPHSTPDGLGPAATNGDGLLLRAPSSAPAEVECGVAAATNGGAGAAGGGGGGRSAGGPRTLGFSGLGMGLLSSSSFSSSTAAAVGGHERLSKTRSDNWFSNLFSPSKSRHNSSSTDTHSAHESASAVTSKAIDNVDEIDDGAEETSGSEDSEEVLVANGESITQLRSKKKRKKFKNAEKQTESISTLCDTMRKQIINRAFYGWLTHVRHMRTVRASLGGLAFDDPIEAVDERWYEGVQEDWWHQNQMELILGGNGGGGGGGGKESDARNTNNVQDFETEVYRRIYFGGIHPDLRKKVWPYLLGHYKWDFGPAEQAAADSRVQEAYEHKLSDWMAIEAIVRQRDKEINAANIAKLSGNVSVVAGESCNNSLYMSNDVFESADDDEPDVSSRTVSHDKISTITEITENSTSNSEEKTRGKLLSTQSEPAVPCNGEEDKAAEVNGVTAADEGIHDDTFSLKEENEGVNAKAKSNNGEAVSYRLTTPSVDSGHEAADSTASPAAGAATSFTTAPSSANILNDLKSITQKIARLGTSSSTPQLPTSSSLDHQGPSTSSRHRPLTVGISLNDDTLSSISTGNHSPVSDYGAGGVGGGGGYGPGAVCSTGTYPQELIDNLGVNLHRIDKDVLRCDRNMAYFTGANLEKLRNVITTYVWDNLEIGYMQGMCDLVAPILVTFDDEALTYACFSKLMQRMICNFPTGTQMDENFASMRSLIQVFDQTLYNAIQQSGDFSHFYFCYRWFLLDFKREFTYSETYLVWETIWASLKVVSSHFYLFVALALVENYRDIIMDRNMDFTDIIKFFNEMAEKHDAIEILQIARDLVNQLQLMISDK